MTEGISHIAVDGFDVWCLEDGAFTFAASDFPGLAFDEQQTRLNAAGLTAIETVFNAFLIRDPEGTHTLVDTGCGAAFGDGAGHLLTRLAALGVSTPDIRRLVFTHLHTDHCGGALSEGEVVFPNADVVLHADEMSYWSEEDHLAQKVVSAYSDKIRTVTDGEKIAPGLVAWALAGHTPGHMGLRVGDKLVLVADIVHSEALQLGDPRLSSENDMDGRLAAECRLSALGEIADFGLLFSGGHILGPEKFGRLVEIGDGFIRVAP
jgi:glyoxylase-like metal-dependent hydrolase (beta-lactamase superfamily II)